MRDTAKPSVKRDAIAYPATPISGDLSLGRAVTQILEWMPRPLNRIEMINMENGTIKWFDTERNYGYIERGNGDIDVFVHGDEIEGGKSLNAGDNVTFEIKEGVGRPKATKVSKA